MRSSASFAGSFGPKKRSIFPGKQNKKHWSDGKTTKVNVGQKAQASINQGGNAISINASDIGVVRIRPQ